MSIYQAFFTSNKVASILMLYPYQSADFNHDNSGLSESGKNLILNHCKQLAEKGDHSADFLTHIDLDTIDAVERIAQDDFVKKILAELKDQYKQPIVRTLQILSAPEFHDTDRPMTIRIRLQYESNQGFKRVTNSKFIVINLGSDDSITIAE